MMTDMHPIDRTVLEDQLRQEHQACHSTCTRIRVALAEQDLEDAQRRVSRAREAIQAAADALEDARADLHLAEAAAWRRKGDLRRARAIVA